MCHFHWNIQTISHYFKTVSINRKCILRCRQFLIEWNIVLDFSINLRIYTLVYGTTQLTNRWILCVIFFRPRNTSNYYYPMVLIGRIRFFSFFRIVIFGWKSSKNPNNFNDRFSTFLVINGPTYVWPSQEKISSKWEKIHDPKLVQEIIRKQKFRFYLLESRFFSRTFRFVHIW